MSLRDPITSVRVRLAVQFALLCAMLLGSCGGAVYVYVRHALHTAFDGAHALAARSVIETVEAGPTGLRVKQQEFLEEFDELKATLGVLAVEVWDAEGTRLAGSTVAGFSQPLLRAGPERELRATHAGAFVVRREKMHLGGGNGLVVIARNAESMDQELGLFRRALFSFVPLAVLASLAVGWWMAGRSLRPVRRVVERQRAFMADASHELRTPIAILQAHTELALDRDADLPALHRSLGVISRTTSNLAVLVNDLMSLARADTSTLEPERVLVDVEELLEETIEDFGPAAKDRGSKILLVSCPRIHLRADPTQLKRLVAVFLDNALRHAVPCEIRVSVTESDEGFTLSVEDEGPGIPDDLLPRVLERFVRGEQASANVGGNGLGLAIAQSIALAHRGHVAIRRNARGGTTASVVIPDVSPALPWWRRRERSAQNDVD